MRSGCTNLYGCSCERLCGDQHPRGERADLGSGELSFAGIEASALELGARFPAKVKCLVATIDTLLCGKVHWNKMLGLGGGRIRQAHGRLRGCQGCRVGLGMSYTAHDSSEMGSIAVGLPVN